MDSNFQLRDSHLGGSLSGWFYVSDEPKTTDSGHNTKTADVWSHGGQRNLIQNYHHQ